MVKEAASYFSILRSSRREEQRETRGKQEARGRLMKTFTDPKVWPIWKKSAEARQINDGTGTLARGTRRWQ